jgi:hypothetical protein
LRKYSKNCRPTVKAKVLTIKAKSIWIFERVEVGLHSSTSASDGGEGQQL